MWSHVSYILHILNWRIHKTPKDTFASHLFPIFRVSERQDLSGSFVISCNQLVGFALWSFVDLRNPLLGPSSFLQFLFLSPFLLVTFPFLLPSFYSFSLFSVSNNAVASSAWLQGTACQRFKDHKQYKPHKVMCDCFCLVLPCIFPKTCWNSLDEHGPWLSSRWKCTAVRLVFQSALWDRLVLHSLDSLWPANP